jgi:hypothetical protein
LDAIGVGFSLALVFVAGLGWKIGLAAALAAALTVRVFIERRTNQGSPVLPEQSTLRVTKAGVQSAPKQLDLAPRIAIYLPEPSCSRHPLQQADGHELGRDAIFCHLGVKSMTGSGVAGCRAFLRKVAYVQNRQYMEDKQFTKPLRLKWAHYMPDDPRAELNDVEPDDPRLIDIIWLTRRVQGKPTSQRSTRLRSAFRRHLVPASTA